MRRSLISIALCVLMLALAAGCGNAPDAAPVGAEPPVATPGAVATVRYVAGESYLLRGDDELPLAVGDTLAAGDEIATGKDGLVILKMAGGKQLHIAENSLLGIAELEAGEAGEETLLSLYSGNVISVIPEELGEADSYEVETPTLIMAIRGTIASVSYDADARQSGVSFFDGQGIVSSKMGVDVIEIAAGEQIRADDGRLDREAITRTSLSESEERFLYDADYRAALDSDEATDIARRVEAVIDGLAAPETGPAIAVQPAAPVAAPTQPGDASPAPAPAQEEPAAADDPADAADSDNAMNDPSFRAIHQRFLDAKRDYNRGLITKSEFLQAKQDYIDAKRTYFGDDN